MSDLCDTVIVGGGPAGVVLARQLKGLGLRPTVVTRPRPFAATEGFSPRTMDLVSRFCGDSGQAGLISRTVYWNGEVGAANREALIDRCAFDQALVADAEGLGVNVIDGRVQTTARSGAEWHIGYRTRGGREGVLKARFLVEARGRSAPLGRGGQVRGPALVCLSRRWGFSDRGPEQAAVAAFENGWAWFVRPRHGDAVLQIFVDPGDGLPPRRQLGAFYQDAIGQIAEAQGWLGGANPSGPMRARHAGMVLSGTLSAPDYLRLGDAAMAIDPLSGHGVYKAISSALAAVPVVNTLLARPGDAALAGGFYRDRIADDFWTSARIARDFYAEEGRWSDRPFWSARRAWPDFAPAHPDVKAGMMTVERRAVARDNYVEEADVLVTPDQPRGVWHVAGLPAVSLWSLLRQGTPSIDHLAQRFGVAPAAAKAALEWFRERGLMNAHD